MHRQSFHLQHTHKHKLCNFLYIHSYCIYTTWITLTNNIYVTHMLLFFVGISLRSLFWLTELVRLSATLGRSRLRWHLSTQTSARQSLETWHSSFQQVRSQTKPYQRKIEWELDVKIFSSSSFVGFSWCVWASLFFFWFVRQGYLFSLIPLSILFIISSTTAHFKNIYLYIYVLISWKMKI